MARDLDSPESERRDGYLELAGEGPIDLHLKTGRLQLKGMFALVWLERVGITATVNSVFRYYRP